MERIALEDKRPSGDSVMLRGANTVTNPWANEYVLMALSLWWVQRTLPASANFDHEVASTMDSLRREFGSAA